MASSTLDDIKRKVRRLTASPSPNQLSESDLEHYIDTFYEADLPAHLKIWNLHSNYEFWTVANEDRYDFDTDLYTAALPPLYIDGYQSFYSQSQEEFFRIYPKTTTQYTGPSGDGTAGPYSFTLSSTPVLKREVTVSAVDTSGDTQTAYDSPQAGSETLGDLIDASDNTTVLGQINYVTGAVSALTFTSAIPASESIITRYVAYQANRPTAGLFFNSYFILRPVPDKVYKVSIEVYQKPSQLLSANNNAGTNTPDVQQWWQYIAFGAAIKVLEDRQDMESIQNIMPAFERQESLVLNRTATELANQRTATIYTDQLQYPVGNRQFGGS
jgi:hypothetical protein